VSLIRKALGNLPKTLDDTYSRLFLEIDEDYREEAMNALLWLAFSNRPLLLTELAEAIVIKPQAKPPFDPEERFPDSESVLQILSSLVTISRNEFEANLLETVTLAHFSVKEYLVSDRVRTSPAQYFAMSYSAGHYFIAECCLLYILHYADSTMKEESTVSRVDVHYLHLERLPLLRYASNSWFAHINMLPLDQQKLLTPLVLKLLLSENALSRWHFVRLLTSSRGIAIDTCPDLLPFDLRTEGPLCYASSLGLFDVVKELLASGTDPNVSIRYPPLHRAIIEDHDKVAILLLSHGADIIGKDHLGYSPLHHATEIGNFSMVQVLFMYGAQPSPRDHQGATPLHLAALHSHERIAEFLVVRGAEVEVATTDELRTPFHWAAWNESKRLVELFLKHGANINAQNYDGETALHYAARENQMVLQDLLDNGADLEVETHSGETPLYWAAIGEYRGPTEKLVKAGAKIALPLLLLAKDEFLPVHRRKFHLLLEVGMSANEETASLTLLTLQECARMEYALCEECQRILLESSGGRSMQQILPIRNSEEAPKHWPFKARPEYPLLSEIESTEETA
jgi:ankyrin repeat protein